MKVGMTKKNIVASQLADRRFHQRVIKDKTKYNRKQKNRSEW